MASVKVTIEFDTRGPTDQIRRTAIYDSTTGEMTVTGQFLPHEFGIISGIHSVLRNVADKFPKDDPPRDGA